MKKTLKELKKELEHSNNEEDYSKSLLICEEIIDNFSKNSYGYISKIKVITQNYKKYLNEDKLNQIKKIYDKVINLIPKKDIKKFEEEYDRYLDDCREVENYKKLKIKIISKKLTKEIINSKINIIDNEIKLLENTSVKKHKINTFIHGIFLILCFIYNIFNPNYLLFLTIPFGVFGIISVITYVNSIIDKRKFINKIKNKEKLLEDKNELEDEALKCNSDIKFNEELINENLSKIPSCFTNYVLSMFEEDSKIINNIILSIKDNDIVTFNYLIDKYTDLKKDEASYYSSLLKEEDTELYKYITKNNKILNTSLNMKKIKLYNYILLSLFIILSIFCSIILHYNFYEINNIAFIISIIVGTLTIIVYDISYKSHTLTDAVNDTLLTTIFNSVLVYNLIYMSITKEFNISYGFIEIPIIFLLVLIGPTYLVVMIKYLIMCKKSLHIYKM